MYGKKEAKIRVNILQSRKLNVIYYEDEIGDSEVSTSAVVCKIGRRFKESLLSPSSSRKYYAAPENRTFEK